MRIFLTLVLLTCPLLLLSGQSRPGSGSGNNPDRGSLTINQDERLDELVRRHIDINRKGEGMQGYRIRIFSQSGQTARQNANTTRAEFFNKFPDVETYLDWDPPNFRVYIGDFRTRSEALKMQREINPDYPNSFIVSSQISLPPL